LPVAGYFHRPVLLDEVLEALAPRPGAWYADGTIGGGGHAAALLRATRPDGRLFGCDRDREAIAAASRALAEFAGRCEIRQGNFAELADWVPPGSCDGVLFDLGVSSHQLDQARRGFSFQQDGPLDMRFDSRESLTAAAVLNRLNQDELEKVLRDYGEERQARRLARAILEERQRGPLKTTAEFAALVARNVRSGGRGIHPATRAFQALRVYVNNEIESLESGLAAAWKLLKPAGRLAAITFHSVEARTVKRFGETLARDYEVIGDVDVPALRKPRAPRLRWVSRRGIPPSPAEIASNPRARSARLRVMAKLGD
jgi:16S rRNA (cytosine1402-N4)-methyltransferase